MRNKILYLVVGLLFVGYLVLELVPRKPYDWSVGYGTRENKPFGTKLLHERLPDLFPGQEIRTVQSEPARVLKEFEKKPSNYIIITGDLDMSTRDTETMLAFVRRGNTLLLAAETFSGAMADSLNLENKLDFLEETDELLKPPPKDNYLMFLDSSETVLNKRFPLMDYIHYNKLPYPDGEVLSVNKEGEPVFTRIPVGDGAVFVHSVPFIFTNYYMVDPVCHQYISHALSYLPVQPVIWDDHYKPANVDLQSTVSFILDSPALRFGWILLMVTLVIFVLFDGKRKQRIIPPAEPNANTTLEFVQTVSRLYLGHADHQDIANKKIKYFLEYVRTRWMINTQELNEAFETRLAAKSGVPLHEVKELCQVIRGIQTADKKQVDGTGLVLVSRKIESFYANSQ